MRGLVLVLLAAGLYGGYNWWQGGLSGSGASSDAFIPVAMPGGVGRNTVLVLAPRDCPSIEAQRTEALVRELKRKGIPVIQREGFSFDVENPTREQREAIDRTVAVFKRGAPTVYVNGMGMANPTVEQTITVYRAIRGESVRIDS